MTKKIKGWFIALILIILLGILITFCIIYAVIKAADKMEKFCKENKMYYESYSGNSKLCCEILQDNGFHCYNIEKINGEYYLNKLSKNP